MTLLLIFFDKEFTKRIFFLLKLKMYKKNVPDLVDNTD